MKTAKKKRTRKVEIVERATKKVVHTIETDKTGATYDRMINGLHRKVDFDRFYIRQVP